MGSPSTVVVLGLLQVCAPGTGQVISVKCDVKNPLLSAEVVFVDLLSMVTLTLGSRNLTKASARHATLGI